MTDLGLSALSAITVFSKYAKHIDLDKRRESWEEVVSRYVNMMSKKYPKLKDRIEDMSKYFGKEGASLHESFTICWSCCRGE